MTKPLTLIVACTENRVIGRNGLLPFKIPEDKTWFEEKTAGKTVVVGRRSFQQWREVMTSGRQPVVVTRDQSIASPQVRVAATVPGALAVAQTLPGEIMICGGQQIYEETLPLARRLVLTLVHTELSGDRWFPEWRNQSWRAVWKRESHDANFRYTFLILER